ncbi:MAG: tetratricopeptide repeat protein [Candidatus Eremiobacteraeota bacterium]|nr:tetratricopeptide repeat protein [Candidatus Eremiobacteraeota bacterium]
MTIVLWLRSWLVACWVVMASLALGQAGTRQDALALEQQGRNAEAAEIWRSIAQHDPRNAEAVAHLGLIEARQEHYGQAISHYRKALELDPAFPQLQMNLGLALFKTDQFGDAAKAFGAELEKHPGDARLITLLGMTHYAMGDYLVAIPYLQKATEGGSPKDDSQMAALRLTLARSCLWSRQYACVIQSAGEIPATNPGSAEAAMLAGEVLDAEGKTAAAIERFKATIEANPRQPDAHFGLGYLYWRQGQFAEAAAAFKAELELNPSNDEARGYLAPVANRKEPARSLIEVMPNAQPPAQP